MSPGSSNHRRRTRWGQRQRCDARVKNPVKIGKNGVRVAHSLFCRAWAMPNGRCGCMAALRQVPGPQRARRASSPRWSRGGASGLSGDTPKAGGSQRAGRAARHGLQRLCASAPAPRLTSSVPAVSRSTVRWSSPYSRARRETAYRRRKRRQCSTPMSGRKQTAHWAGSVSRSRLAR